MDFLIFDKYALYIWVYKNLKAKLININAINISICIDIFVALIEEP
jgi:hypothetical protein